MSYKIFVQGITGLPWKKYDPKMIIYLSWCTAVEFAESLRCALKVFPLNEDLRKMAEDELMTNNLIYGNYDKIGDHKQFLDYFVCQDTSIFPTRKIIDSVRNYSNFVKGFSNEERAMTIFSREQELPGIFKVILNSHTWEKYGWFKYYLERHIELDSQDGGHAELTKGFGLDETVLKKFYSVRLNLYKSLEN